MVWHSVRYLQSTSSATVQPSLSRDLTPDKYDIGGVEVFVRWATPRRLITVAFANGAYLEQGLLQNLVCSWRRLRFENYAVVPVDDVAYRKLSYDPSLAAHTHHYPPYWSGTSSGLLRPTNIKTPEYVRFIHKRTRFVEALLLSTNLDVLLTDGDTVWLHQPFPDVIPLYDPRHARCDAFVVNSAHRGGDGPDRVEPLGGFILVRNNARSLMWYRTWTAMEACLQSKEQPAMHASLAVLDARFARAGQLEEDLVKLQQTTPLSVPVLCVLHDAHFPTGFHMTDNYIKDYGNLNAVVLGHASIPKKTGKEEWFAQYGWWMVDGKGGCRPPAVQGPLAPIPPNRLKGNVVHHHVAHYTKTCAPLISQHLPELRRQVDAAVQLRHKLLRRNPTPVGYEYLVVLVLMMCAVAVLGFRVMRWR